MEPEQQTAQVERRSFRMREIWGVLLFSTSVFCLVSVHWEGTGIIGAQAAAFLAEIFGHGQDIILILTGFLSVYLFAGLQASHAPSRFAGLFLLAVTGLCTLQLAWDLLVPMPYWGDSLTHISHSPSGGGVVGALMLRSFRYAFGLRGTYIWLSTLAIIGLSLTADFPVSRLFGFVIRGISHLLIRAGHTVRKFLIGLALEIADAINVLRGRRPARATNAVERMEDPLTLEPTPDGEVEEAALADAVEVERMAQPAAQRKANTGRLVTKEATNETTEFRGRRVKKAAVSSPAGLPDLTILQSTGGSWTRRGNRKETRDQAKQLEKTLEDFGIEAKVVNATCGPVVTRYEVQPARGVKVSRIVGLADDIALALAAADVRIEAPVPGKSVVGIEIPNQETTTVYIGDVLSSPAFLRSTAILPMAVGVDISGNVVVADMAKLIHLLVAGATGSGKSVCLNTLITSLLFKKTPKELRMLMIDPKRVELAVYNEIPHLLAPVVTDARKAATALRWVVQEMEHRYEVFANDGVRNITSYNQLAEKKDELEPLPYIVVIVDELADLMMVAQSEVEDAICRLAQMARAAGIHMIIATQRPSVDVVTGVIKANIPSRLSFAVSSHTDSRTILDSGGAERLLGKGDMLYYPIGANKPVRLQGPFIADDEVEAVVKFWASKEEFEPPEEDILASQEQAEAQGEVDDDLFDDAVRLVVETGQASISMIQRRFRVGYARAARLVDMMELQGVVGPHQGSKPREVRVDPGEIDEVLEGIHSSGPGPQ